MAVRGASLLASLPALERALAGLRYQTIGARDLRIDLLRGFCVFAMVVDHIGGASWLYAVTGGNQFVVSAAEGFIFLSGFLVGVVYRRVIERSGLGAGIRKALERAARLYVVAVGLAIGFGLTSAAAGLWWGSEEIADPLYFVLEVLTLQRAYYLADVMLLYALLLGVTPLALLALRWGRWWLVIAASVGLWAAYQLSPQPIEIPWHIHEHTVFEFAPWQVLFFAAMVLGWYRDGLGARVSKVLLQPVPLVISAGLGAAAIALWSTDPANLSGLLGDQAALTLYDWFDKSRLPLPRLLATAVFFHLAFAGVTLLWGAASRSLGWLLLPFGEQTLLAYSAHLFLLVGVGFVTAAIPGFDPHDATANTLAQIGVVLTLWLLVVGFAWLRRAAASLRSRMSEQPSAEGSRPGLSFPWWQAGAALVAAVAVVAGWQTIGGLLVPPAAVEDSTDSAEPVIVYVRPTTLAEEPLTEVEQVDISETSEYAGLVQNSSFWSETIGREMPYLIYLPPDYEDSGLRYPTVYLLHGVGGHYGEWFGYGLINEADRMIAEGEIQPMIVVLPQGDQDYWINVADGGPRWSDYVAYDVVQHIDNTYRTIPLPEARAIGGLSMGAHGALQIGFNFPNVFGVIGSHSPSIRTFDESPLFFGDEEHFSHYDPISLARTIATDTGQQIWLDRGESDIWFEQTDLLASILEERGIPFYWNILPGEHDGFYWEANAPVYLKFYSDVLLSEALLAER